MLGEITNHLGEKLEHTYHPGNEGSKCLVLIGHGVTGNKDRPLLIALAEALSAAGIPALRFSFAGNGASEGKFDECNISKEVEELGAIVSRFSDRNICYVGHSMGAAVGLLRARQDKRIHFLVSLAGMINTKGFAEREFGSVKPGNGLMWDKPGCPLSQAFMDDLRRIDSLTAIAKQLKTPWLLVHGSNDDVVPMEDTLDAYGKGDGLTNMVEIEGADHVFSPPHTDTMTRTVVDWVKRRMTPEWCAEPR